MQTDIRASNRFLLSKNLWVAAALLVVAAAMLATSPHGGDFFNNDAPRHAMNGVFLMDFITSHPFRNPVGYAVDYYLKYPALTIGRYPSIFYVISIPFFALFGVSHLAALLPVTVLFLGYIAGCYSVARRWLSRPLALAVSLATAGAPEIAMWGRQVMLDIPACTLQVWSFWCMLRYADSSRVRWLYGSALLFAGAVYIKIPAIFFGAVLLTVLLLYKGPRIFQKREVIACLLLMVTILIPLGITMQVFGKFDVGSVTVHRTGAISFTERNTVKNWFWYLRALPAQLGWPLLTASALGALLVAMVPKWRLPWRDGALLLSWFGIGYLFFSAIDLKDNRFDIAILFPLILCAGILTARLLPARAAATVGLAAALSLVISTLILHPVPTIDGYRAAADYIAAHAPKNAVVLFSGYRDGTFIFSLRGEESRRDLSVVRSDKLFLTGLSVAREFGVQERSYSEPEICQLLTGYGVRYVVAQTDFWVDLGVMARLQSALHSSQFDVVARIPIAANTTEGFKDRELVIYRNRQSPPEHIAPLSIEVPTLGRSLQAR